MHLGRADGLLTIELATSDEPVKAIRLLARDPDAELRCNGGQLTYPELMLTLADQQGPVNVKIWPEQARHGAAVRAEFKAAVS